MDHNHQLANQEFVQFFRSHMSVNTADLEHAILMHGIGIRISQIVDLQAYQVGGHNKMRYIQNDLRNTVDQFHRNVLEVGDASQVLAYWMVEQMMSRISFTIMLLTWRSD